MSFSILFFCLKMPKDHCCAYNCTNSKEEKTNPVKYPKVANVTFHCFPPNNEKMQFVPGMSGQERRWRWIACRITFTFVSFHFILFSQAYCKFNEILGQKERNTSWNILGRTVVINVVFIAHKMFHEKFNYVFYLLTTNKNHLICPWST